MRALIDHIEAMLHHDVGRGMAAVFQASRGGLSGAASALAAAASPRIGLLTGFFVPGGQPPAAETDGPAGAALLARGFIHAGLACRVATDTICRSAVAAALASADAGAVAVDTIPPGGPAGAIEPGDRMRALIDLWRRDGIDWVIAIERCGPAADGHPRNMRGVDISGHVAPLEQLFSVGPWRTIAIGDGGNEIGMGVLPVGLIAEAVPLGASIGCVVPADHLITAGVSHWGAYGLLAALAVLRPDWRAAMLVALDPDLDQAVIEAMVRDGPAVDGVSLRREATIDSLPMAVHHARLASVRACLSDHGA